MPTTAELGFPEIQIDNWVGLSGTANLPAPIVERLRAETVAALATPEVRRRLEERGITGEPLGPEAFAGRLEESPQTLFRALSRLAVIKSLVQAAHDVILKVVGDAQEGGAEHLRETVEHPCLLGLAKLSVGQVA